MRDRPASSQSRARAEPASPSLPAEPINHEYPAVLAKENGVPFYVAAPTTTIDLACPDGRAIPIEERDASEVVQFAGKSVAPAGVTGRYVAFDVTPARFITAIVTEAGVCEPPFGQTLRRAVDHAHRK